MSNQTTNNIQTNAQPSTESFLDEYLSYTRKQESPEMFHLWCALSVLSVVMGRKCFIDRGYYRLYPNLFTLLVAGSARCRKSTAIAIATRLLNDIVAQGRLKVVSGKITPERFIEELVQIPDPSAKPGEVKFRTPDILVVSSELSVMLTKQSYGEPLIHILTDLFDCPSEWTYKTKNKGDVTLSDVFITILGATTPTGVAHGIPATALQEGFASRVVFCFQGDTTRRNPFPKLNQQEIDLWLKLKDMLLARALLQGEFTLTDDGREWFIEWYNKHMDSDPEDLRLDGMHGRKHDHLLRVAMIMAGSYATTKINLGHLEAALMSLNAIEEFASSAFAELGGDETTPHLARMKAYLKRMRVIDRSLLLMRMHPVNAATFKVLVDTAMQSGWMLRDKEKPNLFIWNGEKAL